MSQNLTDVNLYFANGLHIKAKSFGAQGTFIGEVVFNTSMTGYQEIITDPSYSGQLVVLSMPEIGIVGTNAKDSESAKCSCVGIIVASYNDFTSAQNRVWQIILKIIILWESAMSIHANSLKCSPIKVQ